MKKVLALLLASVMVLALLAGCGGGNNDNNSNNNSTPSASDNSNTSPPSTPSNTGDGSVPTVTWYSVGGGMPANWDSWTAQVNAYLDEKGVGAHLNMQVVSWGDWGNRRSVIVQTNEPYDIMFADMGSYTSDVAMGAFADITDLMSEVPGLTDLIPADYLKACEINGRLYAIPAYKDSSMTNFFLWTKERVEPAYPGWADIHSLEDATPALEAMKDMWSEPPVLFNQDGLSCVTQMVYDNMGIGLSALGVSYRAGDNKITSIFEQEEILEQLRILNSWMKNGLINSDAAVLAEASGLCGVSVAQGWPAAAKSWGDGRGAEVVVSQYGETVVSNDTVQGSMACISASSEHKVEALKVLELVNTDSYMRDLMYYGEEGVNWEYVTENGEQKIHQLNTDWTMAGYTQGTTKTVTALEGNEPFFNEVDAQNKNAIASPALGFYFDAQAAGVADKISACQAVFEGYKSILLTGTANPDETVPEMMASMRAAGFDEVQAAVQEAFDAWLAGN
ncbi:MAG: ABC transporter substrate-binding protein [Oscillospiraceae bacterium]|nr:ABC transporter substrate-binding protein [Oscillospiraceae bacterium]